MDMAAEEEESDGSYESSVEYESVTGDSETGSEESGGSPTPATRLRVSPSTPSMQDPSHRPDEQPFPSSPTSKPTLPPPHTDPSAPPRAAPVAPPNNSSGSRIRKLSQSLRKSRSMTFGSARGPTSSNNAEAPPPPPVPPLPLSVAQSRSATPLTGRSKPLPPQPSSPSSSRGASSSRQAPPSLPHESPAHKRYPSGQNLPQTPTKPKKKQAASEALKPPELKRLPELLPIFVEMVRCWLHYCEVHLLTLCFADAAITIPADGDLMDQ